MKSDFSIILFDNARGRSYIQQICNAGFLPAEVLLMPGEWKKPEGLENFPGMHFDIDETIFETMEKHGLKIVPLKEADINAEDTVNAVKNSHATYIVFGGRGGQLLKPEILNAGKPILHMHPGITPYFRGSTTVYYSNLVNGKAGCTAFFFNEKIDEGRMVCQAEYDLIHNMDIDYLFDPDIRGQTLVKAATILRESIVSYEQKEAEGAYPYFIIHPVLKHLSILKNTRG